MTDWNPQSLTPPTHLPWGINFGAGLNSTALIIEAYRRDMRPDWILFADTGSERDDTYRHIEVMRAWCKVRDLPFDTTRWERQEPINGSTFESLEANCLRTNYMPSKAYGYSGCSFKYKKQPAERWRREHGFSPTVYAIGFDAGEHRRVNKRGCMRKQVDQEADDEQPWYPLYAWGITREACQDIVASEGMTVGKSACFFCPNNKKPEWDDLRANHPDLWQRALDIEAKAVANGNAINNGLLRSQGFLRDYAEEDLPEITVPPEHQNCMCAE